MVSLDDVKDLMLYKRPFFLPVDPKNKKKGSVVMLLSPNYKSSMNMMNAPYIINKRSFESYYIEKSIQRYIKNESVYDMDDPGEYLYEVAPSVEVNIDPSSITSENIAEDANGEPLIGVSVIEKGTNNGTVTDIDGNYVLEVNPDAKLLFSYVGYTAQEVNAASGKVVVLQEDNKVLSEVVVVGYGTMRRKDVTSSITTIKSEDLNIGVVTTPGQMLQGKVPGLVVSASSDPNATPSITLRGASTLRTGEAMEPYYIVDGIPGVDLSLVSPDDIETIDVLRDATATAIYGSKAANGVIIITTKKGKEGTAHISYNGYVAFEKVAKNLDLATATDLRNYAAANNFELTSDKGADTDWQKEVQRTGVSHNHNISVSGGNAKSNYNVSLNYMNHEGVVHGTDMERFTARAFGQSTVLKDHLTLSLGVNASQTTSNEIPTTERKTLRNMWLRPRRRTGFLIRTPQVIPSH